MRTNIILAATLFAATAFTACDKDNGASQPDGRTPVRFAADIAKTATPATRAAGTAWAANDDIGIFMVAVGTTTVVEGAANKQYATATTAGEFAPADAGQTVYYPQDGSAVDFIAYYPWKTGAALGTSLNIEIETAQTEDNQPSFDLLWGGTSADTPDGFSKSDGADVALIFDHVLTKFVIKPVNGTDVTAAELAEMTVKIEGMNTTGTFNLATGTPGGTPGTVADIIPRKATDNGSMFDAIVMPGGYAAGTVKVLFSVGGDTFTWTLDAETFTGGNQYGYTVTLSRTPAGTAVAVTGTTIDPWTPKDKGDVTVTPVWAITWELNGGAWPTDDNHVERVWQDGGTIATAPNAPTRSDYTFGGWYTDAEQNTAVTWPLDLDANVTLYAKWTEDVAGGRADLLGNVRWALRSDGTITITGKGRMYGWSSASEVPWDSHRNAIKSVTVGEGVTVVGGYAFRNCINLTSVTLPESVVRIEGFAFYDCTALTSVTLQKGLKELGTGAFSGCSLLKDVYILAPPPSIGSHPFYGISTSKVLYVSSAYYHRYQTNDVDAKNWREMFPTIQEISTP